MKKLISIITPTFNEETNIEKLSDAIAFLNENNPKLMFETIVDGTKHMLDFAVKKKLKNFYI
jgi:hypothetical protein